MMQIVWELVVLYHRPSYRKTSSIFLIWHQRRVLYSAMKTEGISRKPLEQLKKVHRNGTISFFHEELLIDCNEERCWQQQRGGGGTWQWEEVRVGNGDDGYWWPWAVVTMGSGEDGKWWKTGRFDSCTWLSREVVKRSGWEGVTTRCGEEGAWRREGKLSSGLMRKESGEEGKRCRRQVLNGKESRAQKVCFSV